MDRRKRRWLIALALCAALLVAGLLWNRSLRYVHSAPEDSWGLWVAVHKGIFTWPVHYMGSDREYSYFRTGKYYYGRYKVQTSILHLPRLFSFGQGEPYRVTGEMVPRY